MEANKFEIVYLDPRDLIPYDKNAKIHSSRQVQELALAIQSRGFDQPITVDKDYVIITGHGRREASIVAGLAKVPVIIRADLTEKEVMAKRIEDNRLASTDYDTELLAEEAIELDGLGEVAFGFDDREWEMLTGDLAATLNESEMLDDLDSEIEEQARRHEESSERADIAEVRVGDAFGFKTIPGKHQRLVSEFMADVETKTGKVGQEAFVAYLIQEYA